MHETPSVATQWKPSPKKRKRRWRRWRGPLLRLIVLLSVLLLWRHFHPGSHPQGPTVPSPVVAVPHYPDPPGIVLHASDSPGRWHGQAFDAARLEEIHAEDHPGWATVWEGKTYHIGYHFVILPNGKIEPGRPIYCPGAHTIHHNDWIGICVVGAFSTVSNPRYRPRRPTPQQMTSVTSLCEQLMSRYHIPPERVKRHRDLRMTWCPGSRFPYPWLMKRLRAYATTHPETRQRTPLVAKRLLHPEADDRETESAPRQKL